MTLTILSRILLLKSKALPWLLLTGVVSLVGSHWYAYDQGAKHAVRIDVKDVRADLLTRDEALVMVAEAEVAKDQEIRRLLEQLRNLGDENETIRNHINESVDPALVCVVFRGHYWDSKRGVCRDIR